MARYSLTFDNDGFDVVGIRSVLGILYTLYRLKLVDVYAFD